MHPIRGLYRTFFEKFLFRFPFSHKRFQMGQKMYFHQLYKLQQKSSTNPVSVYKWEIAPFPLQRILGFVEFHPVSSFLSFFLPSFIFFFCWNWLLLKLLLSKWKPIINFVAKPKPWDLWHKGYSFVFWSQFIELIMILERYSKIMSTDFLPWKIRAK